MRVLLASAAALMVLAVSHAAGQTARVSSWPSLGFAAEFPGKPELESTPAEGEGTFSSQMVSSSSKDGYFAVSVATIEEFTAEAIADSATRERIFDGAQSNSIEQGGTTLKSQRSLMLDGRYGREFISAMPDGSAMVHTRAYLEPSRLYIQIAVITNRKAPKTGTRFLNSFKFL